MTVSKNIFTLTVSVMAGGKGKDVASPASKFVSQSEERINRFASAGVWSPTTVRAVRRNVALSSVDIAAAAAVAALPTSSSSLPSRKRTFEDAPRDELEDTPREQTFEDAPRLPSTVPSRRSRHQRIASCNVHDATFEENVEEAYEEIEEEVVKLCPIFMVDGVAMSPSIVKTIEGLAAYLEGAEDDAVHVLVADELGCALRYKGAKEPAAGPPYKRYECSCDGCKFKATAVLDEDNDRFVIGTYGEHNHTPLKRYRIRLFKQFGDARVWTEVQSVADKLVAIHKTTAQHLMDALVKLAPHRGVVFLLLWASL